MWALRSLLFTALPTVLPVPLPATLRALSLSVPSWFLITASHAFVVPCRADVGLHLLACAGLVTRVAADHALDQFCLSSCFGPGPYIVRDLRQTIDMINFQVVPASAVNARAVFLDPLLATARDPLSLVLTLSFRV